MAKELLTVIKLQIPGGGATPAPPVGPALGQHGLNIQDFVNKFNDKTKDKRGDIIPVEISVYKDRTFDFIMKTPPAAELLKKAANIKKGAGKPNMERAGIVTWQQCVEIAQVKLEDLNCDTPERGAHMIAGTAKQMGIEVQGAPTE